ncbi:MAG: hypothetical protein A3D92_19720 [Bacteroidetes bacterium RIFCSPHIGHO2_02_FULL_44_7]|nr:MAG: hypothetical protein A3D92_19720 [Bacteroidetes bacterium RIFCSPHIGHO2_02_FULL_44_7]
MLLMMKSVKGSLFGVDLAIQYVQVQWAMQVILVILVTHEKYTAISSYLLLIYGNAFCAAGQDG